LLADDGILVETRVHDVTDAEGAGALAEEIESEIGPVDTLITVAGVLTVGPLPDSAEAYSQPLDIMLRGHINMVHAVLPAMRRRGHGRIGVVTSIGGIIPVPHMVPYSVAKFGAVGFARGLTTELMGSGISVSTIIPGLMRTGGQWNGDFHGQAEKEYAWFSAMGSLPVVSMDANHAAQIIVRGVLRGKQTIIYTPLARVGARLFGIAPRMMTRMMGYAAHLLLPSPGDEHEVGHEADAGVRSRMYDRLTELGRKAVHDLNQLGAHDRSVDPAAQETPGREN
jgi:short-subunit dehydrogenase